MPSSNLFYAWWALYGLLAVGGYAALFVILTGS
jgi:hypothetical protein